MNLHEDKDAFAELVAVAAEVVGLPQVYVEKDYWITRALKYLSESSYLNEVVFKGGTSLSKAHKLVQRFSEDIDLAVFAGDKGDSQRKKLLKSVEGVVAGNLTYLDNDVRNSKGSKFRKTAYRYPRHIDGMDFGQASPEILIEVNAFTNPEPFEACELQTLITEALSGQDRHDLIESFRLNSFSINVLSVSRTLVEKILGIIKDSYHENPTQKISNRIRHLYDICLILKKDEHRAFLASDEFETLCDICLEDERQGVFDNSGHFDKPLIEAPLFYRFGEWSDTLNTTYNGIFKDLVYGDLPPMDSIQETVDFIKECL